ncbi:MAG: hypothetical protein CFE44_03390 [Burkholderiales bacterium PBB4]|nr:MAG: hypothetical protein CFE44_03390 [Burkholderiales bacterium PBB4]
MAAEGIQLAVEFYPWSRALLTAKGERYVGVYPTWPEDVLPGFTASPVIVRSPVGFVEPKSAPLSWVRLEDLAGKRIGIVQDYGNTVEFMHLVRNKTLKVEVVIDGLTNIRKVAGRRIDAALIDLHNLSYYLKHDAKALAHQVQANARAIGTKDLVLSINRKFAHRSAFDTLARGLSKIDPDKIINDYLSRHSL